MRFLMCLLTLCGLIASSLAEEKKEQPAEPAKAPRNTTLVFNPGHHMGPIVELMFTPDGKQVVSVGADQTVQVWDVRGGQRLRVLRLPSGGVLAAALAPDGKTLLLTRHYRADGGPGKPAISIAYLLNLEDGRIVPLWGENVDHPGGGFAAAGLAAEGDRAFVVMKGTCWVWTGLKNVWARDPGQAGIKAVANFNCLSKNDRDAQLRPGLASTPDGGRLAVRGNMGGFQIWDVSTADKPAQVLNWPAADGEVHGLAWSQDGKRLVTGHCCQQKGSPNPVRLWSADGKELKTFTVEAKHGGRWESYYRTIFRNANELLLFCASGGPRFVLLLNLDTGSIRELCRTGESDFWGTVGALSPNGQVGALAHGPGRTRVVLFPVQEKAPLRYLAGSPHGSHLVGWSPTSQAVARNARTPNQLDVAFDLKELRIPQRFAAETFVRTVSKRDGWEVSPIGDHSRGLKLMIRRDGKQLAVTPPVYAVERSFTLPARGEVRWVAWANGAGFTLHDAATGKIIHRYVHDGAIFAVAPSPDGRYLAAASDIQVLYVYRPEQPTPLLRVFTSGSQWIAVTSQGYYAASPGGEKLMGWRIDNGYYQLATFHPAQRFKKQLYQPELIKLVFEKGDFKEALQTANLKVQDLDKILPPSVALRLGKPEGGKVEVSVTAEAGSKGQPMTELQLLVDGRPARLENGQLAARSFATPQEKATRESWNVKLEPGAHKLSVRATSKDAYSISDEVSVEVKPPVSVPSTSKRGTLYYVGIGINQFKDEPELNLSGAVPDVHNMEKCLRQQCQDHYAVQTTLLTDKEATLAAILKTLADLQDKLKPVDVAIVQYSSHGEVDPEGGLFLLTHDSKRGNLKDTALSGQKLRDILGQYPCPVLLLLDACHSGKFPLLRSATDPLSRLLADDSCGVAVMTAALAHQKAVDTDKGGVFTQGLIEGLSGRAQPNGEGKRLYVHQLFPFVFDFVTGKTDFKQMPLYLPSGSVPPIVLK